MLTFTSFINLIYLLAAHTLGREPRTETSSDHRTEDVAVSALFAVLFGKLFHYP